ncbi:hypothetical protein LIER_12815 [Lithospermum erythrorhizon]|uniref:Zinc finger GRF-type domain-containing protein n=1 Tax=Lithospermum erythrorhizon TaxID=34254 RepID=A0AAV3PXP0_LITER
MQSPMKFYCPCGDKVLSKLISKTEKNPGREFLSCNYCDFFAFVDELRHCPCGRGLCRTRAEGKARYWICPVKGSKPCHFFEEIVSTNTSQNMSSTSQNTEDNQDSLEQLKMELQGVIEKVWCTEDGAVWDKLMQGQPNGSLLKQLTEVV